MAQNLTTVTRMTVLTVLSGTERLKLKVSMTVLLIWSMSRILLPTEDASEKA